MRDFTRKTTDAWPLAIACILHAVALTAVMSVRGPTRSTPPADSAGEIVVEVEPSGMVERAPEAAAKTRATAMAMATKTATRTATRTATETATTTTTEMATATETATPAASSDLPPGSPWTFSPTRVDLGIGDKTGALARQMAQKGELQDGQKPSAGRVVEGLDAADVARGFGRGGPVVQAVEEAAHDPSAPPEGVAMFDIAIEKSGKVSVSVSESTANREDWARLTGDIAKAVQKRSVRLPEGAKGLRVGVRVEAKIRFPDGRDPKKSGAYASGTGLALHDNGNGNVELELPSVGVGVRGKVCSGGISMTMLGPMIGGGCSPENIGTHAERTVGASETYEKRM